MTVATPSPRSGTSTPLRWLGGFWVVVCVVAVALVAGSVQSHELANYTTSLRGRTPGQRHNAKLAAAALDNHVIEPGGTFSFNQTVGPWTHDRGYRKAPVSYGGEMVIAYGGGVCQVSSTLYNAALLAGLTVSERDQHLFQPQYVPAGRDAAVAQGIADLKLVNPLAVPIHLHAVTTDDRLKLTFTASRRPADRYELEVQQLDTLTAPPLVHFERSLTGSDNPRLRRGRDGRQVKVYRLHYRDGQLLERTFLSDDTYLPLGAVVGVRSEPSAEGSLATRRNAR